jgi:hypothetical protein
LHVNIFQVPSSQLTSFLLLASYLSLVLVLVHVIVMCDVWSPARLRMQIMREYTRYHRVFSKELDHGLHGASSDDAF